MDTCFVFSVRSIDSDRGLSKRRQPGCEANTKSVRVRQGEIAQAVMPIGNWHDDICANLVGHSPAVIHVRNHYANIRERKLRWCRKVRGLDLRKGRDLDQKEAVVFPGQFHEVTAVAEKFEP